MEWRSKVILKEVKGNSEMTISGVSGLKYLLNKFQVIHKRL